MKEYKIVKSISFYGVANTKQIKEYAHRHYLPLVLTMKRKKDLIYIIENNEHYKFLKNNIEYKTTYIY